MIKRKVRSDKELDRVIEIHNTADTEKGLMEVIVNALPDAKRQDVKKWLKYGHVWLHGQVTTAFNATVSPGEEVLINLKRPFVVFRHPRLQIVYEDEHVIVVNKGYGLLSVGTASNKKEENAFDILRQYVKRIDPRNKLYVVHRLDRDTSGLMMFVKSEEAQEALRHNWSNMVMDRLYVALLQGVMREDSGVVKSRLAENSQMVVYSTHEPGEGKLAVTRYRVLGRGSGCTLCEFSLDTGRKNQIRVHASDLGHPIVGDRKYGATRSPLGRLALHARSLRFAHPITRQDMCFELPVPSRFTSVVKETRSKEVKNK